MNIKIILSIIGCLSGLTFFYITNKVIFANIIVILLIIICVKYVAKP